MSVANTEVTLQGAEGGRTGPCGEDDCGIREILDRIGDKWSVLVVMELSHGPRGFRDLQRAVPGISQRMLTLVTKNLRRDGLVEREVFATNPPTVEYRLTGLGARLRELVDHMADWSREHVPGIERAREEWDARRDG
ncbi:winged helix-turn-helix transcriptional regulator [Salininema proteolyticum]|uniref:Winged helix-turn-helix transcriptional regulator n=1 Tax=Salininema proteolyticum TaxID=1607685 RepID=A0ABV8TXN7_9ACTN